MRGVRSFSGHAAGLQLLQLCVLELQRLLSCIQLPAQPTICSPTANAIAAKAVVLVVLGSPSQVCGETGGWAAILARRAACANPETGSGRLTGL